MWRFLLRAVSDVKTLVSIIVYLEALIECEAYNFSFPKRLR